MKTRRYASLLGVAFENGSIRFVLLKKVAGELQVRHRLRMEFSLDLATDDPEKVGHEIRNGLIEAGINEKRCVICVPLTRVFTLQTEIPDLSEEDIESFLSVQAEKEFPLVLEDMSLASSRFETPDGKRRATLVAVANQHLHLIQRIFKAARLRPISLSLGVTALLGFKGRSKDGAINLLINEKNIDLAVRSGGGTVALRVLSETAPSGREESPFDIGSIMKDLRITLGRLPGDLADSLRDVYVYGPPERVQVLVADLSEPAGRLGLTVTVGDHGLGPHLTQAEESGDGESISLPALAAAAGIVQQVDPEIELLPSQPNRLMQLAGPVSTRGSRWLATAVAASLVCFGLLFLYQHLRLGRLESEWRSIQANVEEVEFIQNKIKEFRSWYDDSIGSLMIVQSLTEAFPEKGTVWVKNLTIEDSSEVSCAGFAESNREWLEMLERLRQAEGIEDLQFQQVQGDSPQRFAISFRWTGEVSDGS